ncbi:MAG: hypothetical protein QM737_02465 [Ferruginibacter sp.]
MKKRFFIFVLLAIITTSSFSQIIYYDVIKLRGMLDDTRHFPAIKKDSVYTILKKYMANGITTPADFRDCAKNPFTCVYFDAANVFAANFIEKGVDFLPSSIGGLNVTNFADGIAKFLVKRFKEELSITFFQKFKKEIDQSQELRTLFPQTYKVLSAIDKDIYQFSAYLNTLREGFIKDLTNLYIDFKKFTQLDKYKKYFNDHPELNTIISTGLYLIDQYAAGVHAGDVLANYDTSNLKFRDTILRNNIRSSVLLAQAFSASFKSTSADHYWVPADSVKLFLSDKIKLELYFGLMYQKYGNITFYKANADPLRFDKLLNDGKAVADSLAEYKNFAETFIDHAQEVSEYLSEIKGKKKADIDYNDYYKLYNASLDLFEHGLTFIDLPFVDLGTSLEDNIESQSVKWLFVARSAGDMYVDIRTKNYSSAILNAANILDTLLDVRQDAAYARSLSTHLNTLSTALKTAENASAEKTKRYSNKINKIIKKYSKSEDLADVEYRNELHSKGVNDSNVIRCIDSVLLHQRLLNAVGSPKKITTTLLKYGTFASAVAAAKNSDEVEKAIESIALPSGSSRIKRESPFNISVNAYVGGFFGREYLPALKEKQNANTAGLSAPVGVAFSWGNIFKPKADKGGKSISAFISLIDVGALASFRLQNDSSKVASEIQLKNIIAPGAFLYFGFGKVPISIGLGAQLGPQLREVPVKDPQNINIEKNYYIRYGLSIAVDIPVLNLYTRSR